MGGFHLHLLVFTFLYRFHSRIEAIVIMTSLEGFQHHTTISSKFVCCDCYMKKNVAFTLISFAVLKWDDCLSVLVQIPIQLLLKLEANWLECTWNDPLSVPKTDFCSTEIIWLFISSNAIWVTGSDTSSDASRARTKQRGVSSVPFPF